MNFIKLNLLIFFLMFTTGCVNTHKYNDDNLPSFSSAKFPEYKIDSPILEGIEVKLAEGKGETKILMDITVINDNETEKIDIGIYDNWDIMYKDTHFLTKHTMDMSTSIPDFNEQIKIKSDFIHDINGNEINGIITSNILTEKEINETSQEMSEAIRQQIISIGKIIRSGGVFKEIPNPLSKLIPGFNNNLVTLEKVKGWGTYKNKKVIVTETIFEDKIDEQNIRIDIKMKGYSLYDPKTFVLLSGKACVYTNIFIPEEGTVTMKMKAKSETDIHEIYNIIDSKKLSNSISN